MVARLTTVALPVHAAALANVMVSHRPARHLGRVLADFRYGGLMIGPGAGVGPDNCARVLENLATAGRRA
jgi:NAD(P)H-hydrate epimerase